MKTNITQPLLLVCLIFFGLSAYFAPLAIASTSPNQPSINATSNPTDFPGGVISTNTEWDISGSPYRIHGNITIPAGVRLTLDPGVVLQFDSGTGISVYGQLVSTGQPTPTQSVYFTSYRDNSPVSLPTPGIDDGQPGDWAGISFSYGSSGTFSACVIREAANGVNGIIPAIAGANFDRSPVSLNAASDLIVSGNTFNASSLTIQGPNAYDVSVTGNSFSNGSSANFSGYVGSLSLSGNFSGDGNPVNFNFNGLTLSKTSTLIAQSGIHLINSGIISLAAGATLNLGAGLVIQNSSILQNQNARFNIQGDLRGPSSGSPAILTALGDDSVYGGSDNSSPYGWSGVSYATGLNANLTNITIKHALIQVLGSPTTISNGTFDRCNWSINASGNGTVSSSAVTLSNNAFLQSSVSSFSTSPINIIGNTFIGSNLTISGDQTSAAIGIADDVSVTDNSFANGSSIYFTQNLGLLAMSGNVSGDGNPVIFNLSNVTLSKTNTWNPQTGIHLVNSGITVESGATLNLGAGLVIQNPVITGNQFVDYKQIPNFTILGDIRGPSIGSPAILTALGDDSGYGGTDNSNNGWGGIIYGTGLIANLTNITVKHANIGIQGLPNAVSNGVFDRCGQAIYVSGSANTPPSIPFTLSNNTFLSSSVSIISQSGINVTGNTFTSSSMFLDIFDASDVTLTSNSFANNSSTYFRDYLGLLSMSGNTSGDGNPVNFIFTDATFFKTNTWIPQSGIHLVIYDIIIAAGATLNLGSGLILQTNVSPYYPYGFTIQGDLRGPTTGSPAILTAFNDDSGYGGADNAGKSDWVGINYGPGLTANLSNIIIKHASVGLTADTAILNNCIFSQNSTGIVINKGAGVFRNCSFMGNGIAVQNNGTVDVDAQYNWWSDLTGPNNATNNPTGKGDPVSNHVIFSNWLLSNIAAQIGEKADTSIDQRFVNCYYRVVAAIVGSVYNNSHVTAISGSTGTGLAQEFVTGAGARNTILAKDGAAQAYDVSGNTWKWYAAQNFAKGTAGFPTGDLYQEPVGIGTPGFDAQGTVQTFDGGSMFDSSYGTHWVPQSIYSALAPTSVDRINSGGFGFPTNDLIAAPNSPQGTSGSVLSFEHGAVYVTAKYGTRGVYGQIFQQYVTAGSSGGRLGFPTSDPYSYSGGTREDFEGGSLVYGIITPTQIVLQNASSNGSPNQTVTLTATLSTSSGVKLNGKTISYSVDGVVVGTALTNTSGVASRNYIIPATLTPGTHTVTAAFAGDNAYGVSTVNGALILPKYATTLSTLTVTGVQGQTVALSATLKKSTGALVSGETVSFKVDGVVVGAGVTAASGVATYSYTVPATATQGAHTLAVAFAGDSSYLASTATGTLNVLNATTLTVPAASGIHGKSVTLIGILTKSSDGTGIASKVLTFLVDGKSVGTATTGSTGKASVTYTLPTTTTLGSHVVTVTFPIGTINNGATATGTLTVQ